MPAPSRQHTDRLGGSEGGGGGGEGGDVGREREDKEWDKKKKKNGCITRVPGRIPGWPIPGHEPV